jgi:hypothetical protein
MTTNGTMCSNHMREGIQNNRHNTKVFRGAKRRIDKAL